MSDEPFEMEVESDSAPTQGVRELLDSTRLFVTEKGDEIPRWGVRIELWERESDE